MLRRKNGLIGLKILAVMLGGILLYGMIPKQVARAEERTELSEISELDSRTVAHFPLNSEYKLKNRLNTSQELAASAASNARWETECVALYSNSGASNPGNTGHIAGNYPGDAISGDQISFSIDIKVDSNQTRKPSVAEMPIRTIFLFGGKTDYNKDCISLRYFYKEGKSAVVIKQNGSDAVVAEFERPVADVWHNYSISLDGSEGGMLTVWVDGIQAASVDSKGIGADEIGNQVIRLNRATASNSVNVDAKYRDVRILNGLLTAEEARLFSEEIAEFKWRELVADQKNVYEGMTVREDLTLLQGYGITWESSADDIIHGATGKVNRPPEGQEAKEVTLCMLWNGNRQEYHVLVLAQGTDGVTGSAPVVSPAGGTQDNPLDVFQKITLTHPAGDSVIYYTTDGSIPTLESKRYTEPFAVDGYTELKAAAITTGGNRSEIVTSWFYGSEWSATAVEFRLEEQNTVNNAKIAWPIYPEADSYEVYRGDILVGRTVGDVMDEYDLGLDMDYMYTVYAMRNGTVLAETSTNTVHTFSYDLKEIVSSYDNSLGINEDYIVSDTKEPTGIKIGDKYYSYFYKQVPEEICGYENYSSSSTSEKSCKVTGIWERVSDDGINWPDAEDARLIYPYFVDMRLEGSGYMLHPDGETVIFTGHAEGSSGYGAAKVFLASYKPGRSEAGQAQGYGLTVAGGRLVPVASEREQQFENVAPAENELNSYYVGRPFSYDSHDMVIYVEEKDAYLICAVNNNSNTAIIKLAEDWTYPETLMQIAFKGKSQESPAIIKGEDGRYYFFASTANGWLPSQARYASTTALDQPWSPLRPLANASSFSSQANGIWNLEGSSGRTMYRGHGYHWGGNFGDRFYNRFWPTAINNGVATGSWFSRIDYHPYWGGIAVQSGHYLSLGKTAVGNDSDTMQMDASAATDGADLQNSPKLDELDRLPYQVVVDLEKNCILSEINFTTGLVVGSTALTSYTLEGSADGSEWSTLVDGTDNRSPGFVSNRIDDINTYRYIRLTVNKVTNMNNNQSALWAGKLIELAVYGEEAGEDERSVSLQDVENVANAAGTEVRIPIMVKGIGSGRYRSVEGVISIPDAFSVEGMEATDSISGGTLNYTAQVGEDGKLYFAYLDAQAEGEEIGMISQNHEADEVFLLRLKLKDVQEAGSVHLVTIDQFGAKQSIDGEDETAPNTYEAMNFDLAKGSASIMISSGNIGDITAVASVLYTGDGQDLIPSGKTAVSIVFTNVGETADIRIGDTPLYYSQERSDRNGGTVYVGLMDNLVEAEALNAVGEEEVEALYSIMDTGRQEIQFGDTNDDGIINAADALNTLNAWLRNEALEDDRKILIRNVTCDARIDTLDVLAIVDYFLDGKRFTVIQK